MLHQHQQPAPTLPPFITTAEEARQQPAPDADAPTLTKSLTPERQSAADAMRLYMSLSTRLKAAIADRDRHAYRRTLRAFKLAARRLERRYNAITPTPRLKLGNIHRAPKMPAPQLSHAA